MRWPNVQATYPNQWLVIEALEAHTEGNRRILDHIAVVEVCPDSVTAMQTYRLCAYQPRQSGHRRATMGGHQEEQCSSS
jgi:hypothetical protein